MGVTMKCKRTGRSVDLGMGGFYRFRQKVAELASPSFGELHRTLLDAYQIEAGAAREAFYDEINQKTDELIQCGHLKAKIADFCLQPDSGGAVRYGACKAILKAVGDYDDSVCYGYAGRADCAMFSDLKALLNECVETKSDLVWL